MENNNSNSGKNIYNNGISSNPNVDHVYEPVNQQPYNQNNYYQQYHSPQYREYNVNSQPIQKNKGRIPAFVLVLCIIGSVILGSLSGALAMYSFKKNSSTAPSQNSVDQNLPENEINSNNTNDNNQAVNNNSNNSEILEIPETGSRDNQQALSTVEVVEKVADSVVEIVTESVGTTYYMQEYVQEGAGSGVIVRDDGYIITCNHVIENTNKITVTLRNGESYEAQLLAADKSADIAIIKIDANGLTAAVMADSDELKVGEEAIAIGNPLGALGGSVTTGIISALEREITIDGKQMTLLQTNASINRGNSGGGLFDSYGNLIGIVVAKSGGDTVEGIGFAIPSNTVHYIYDELMKNGYVSGRPFLGIVMSEKQGTSANGSRTYVVVTGVYDGYAAQEAGIEVGDIILEIDGNEVDSASQLKKYIQEKRAGDVINILLLRNNQTIELDIELSELRSD